MALLSILALVAIALVLVKVATRALDQENARRRRLFTEWMAAARAAGLEAKQLSDSECRAHGVLHELPLQANLKLEQSSDALVYRSVVWAKSASIPPHLSLSADSALRSMTRWMDGQDVPIGDPAFDERIELPAVDAAVCAALSHQARHRLTLLLDWGGSVQDGMVVCRSTWSADYNRSLTQLLRSVAALARLLSVPASQLPQRLTDNARNDPAPGVRLENLRYLLTSATGAPPELIASTSAALLRDAHAPVRLLAARHAGEAGHAVLRAMAADAQLDRSLRVQAVEALGRDPIPDREGLRAVLLGAHPPELTGAALSVIGASCDTALFEAVLGCTRSEHASVRAGAARALGVLGQPHAEPLLIELLSDASADVQQACAESLGELGSVAAVEPLLPLADNLVRPRLRQAARGAIGRIQSRLGDVEAGRLSLGNPHDLAGALDLVDASARSRVGEVSLAETDAAADAPRARRGEG